MCYLKLPFGHAFLSLSTFILQDTCYTRNHYLSHSEMQLVSDVKIPSVHTPMLCSAIPHCFVEHGYLQTVISSSSWPSRTILNAEDFSLLTNEGFWANRTKLARLLKPLIPISWDSCVFYHLRSANLRHLKLASVCTSACWHPPPSPPWEPCETMSESRQGLIQYSWWTAVYLGWHLALGLSHCKLTHQLDWFCQSSISLLVTRTHLVLPANECLAFDFMGDKKFSAWPDCSALSPMYSDNINLFQLPQKQILPGILAVEKL